MPTEAKLWAAKKSTAESALVFGTGFLGCRMGPNRDKLLDSRARSRLLAIVRAISIVESRHGTVGANQPARDPFQCGNPDDPWWKEVTGQSGTGSRFLRLPDSLSNLWANEVAAAAESTAGFDPAARMAALADAKKGHRNQGFSPAHSYVWGVLYLIHRINRAAGDPSYACGDLSDSRLLDGAVTYNGGGVPNYKARLTTALAEFGGFPS